MENIKEKIKKELLSKKDEKYKEFHSGLCPGTKGIIGVRIPILRKYAKDLSKEYEIKDLILQIDEEYYEEIMLKRNANWIRKERNK